jgi:hypothetical protein
MDACAQAAFQNDEGLERVNSHGAKKGLAVSPAQ